MTPHFILYVSDQSASTEFYTNVLGIRPRLDVPGMAEFDLGSGSVLGLMPETSVTRLFDGSVNTGHSQDRPSRAELYLIVENAAAYHARALDSGAKELSPLALRDWGHRAAYSLDPDGHVIAFAEIPGN